LQPSICSLQCSRAILSSAACSALQHFSTLSHKRLYFRGKIVIAYKICFDFLYIFACNISHPMKTSDKYCHTFKSINQPDTPISQIYCLSFKYSSTCFRHPHAHHQEHINCSSRLWFTVETWW